MELVSKFMVKVNEKALLRNSDFTKNLNTTELN